MYKRDYEAAANLFFLSIDEDDDGKEDSIEQKGVQYKLLERIQMSNLVKQIEDALTSETALAIPTYKELLFKYDVSKNNLINNSKLTN